MQLFVNCILHVCGTYRGPGSAGQECCYNSQSLVVGPPGGGSVNLQPSVDFMSSVKHITEDFIPFLYCCKAGQYSQCDKYYEKRPSDDGTRYQPPPPGGCFLFSSYSASIDFQILYNISIDHRFGTYTCTVMYSAWVIDMLFHYYR